MQRSLHKKMIKKEEEGFTWLEFAQLQPFPHVKHGVFTRASGDFKQNGVDDVRALFSLDAIPLCRQVHRDDLVIIDTPQHGCIGEYDGAITATRGVGLPILHADCQAALFYDPVHNRIANVHAGWRGNLCNIYQKTVDTLRALGSRPQDLLVCISPSLGPNKAEFVHRELSPHFDEYEVAPNHFNLWEVAKAQLQSAGVEKIEVAEICTHTHEDHFFSYRREKMSKET